MKLFVLLLVLVGCGSTAETPRCELGRSAACTCSSGATGAQECGPSGVWSPCVCATLADAGSDAAADVAADAAPVDAAPVDAQADASDAAADAPADVVLVDGAAAPMLYRACDLGADCGPGLACVAVPGLVRDAGAGRGVCTTNCATSAGCAAGALCVMGACQVECPTGEDRECTTWGTLCRFSLVRVEGSRSPSPTATAYCAP